jgi:hypothetical protein
MLVQLQLGYRLGLVVLIQPCHISEMSQSGASHILYETGMKIIFD